MFWGLQAGSARTALLFQQKFFYFRLCSISYSHMQLGRGPAFPPRSVGVCACHVPDVELAVARFQPLVRLGGGPAHPHARLGIAFATFPMGNRRRRHFRRPFVSAQTGPAPPPCSVGVRVCHGIYVILIALAARHSPCASSLRAGGSNIRCSLTFGNECWSL